MLVFGSHGYSRKSSRKRVCGGKWPGRTLDRDLFQDNNITMANNACVATCGSLLQLTTSEKVAGVHQAKK